MQIIFSPKAKEHLDFWVKSGNKPVLNKIVEITKAIMTDPYEGIGKPEPLKYELTGYWSRRITKEHRLVYIITDNILTINSLKSHY